MPLIILGLIVILGGCLLIYYQLGPKVTLRLKNKLSGLGGFGGFGGFGAQDETAGGAEGADAGQEGAQANPGDAEAKSWRSEGESETPDNKKVLYVFGDGEREERSLRDNDRQDE